MKTRTKNVIKYTIGLPVLLIASFLGGLLGIGILVLYEDSYLLEEVIDLWKPID